MKSMNNFSLALIAGLMIAPAAHADLGISTSNSADTSLSAGAGSASADLDAGVTSESDIDTRIGDEENDNLSTEAQGAFEAETEAEADANYDVNDGVDSTMDNDIDGAGINTRIQTITNPGDTGVRSTATGTVDMR